MGELEEKAQKFSRRMDSVAENGAKSFEKYLTEHQNASMEEKHNMLVKCFHASMMLALMTVALN